MGTTTRPGHPLGDEGLDQLRLVLGGLLGGRADQQVLAQPRLALDPRGELRVERVRQVLDDEADPVRAPGAEHRRAGVTLEAEVVDDLADPRRRGGAHPGLAVDHARHGLDRHLGATGDVGHRRTAGTVLRGQIGPLVRQRWHSPHYSGQNGHRQPRPANTACWEADRAEELTATTACPLRLTPEPSMGFSSPHCLTTMSVGRASQHDPDPGRGDRYALVTGQRRPTPHATDAL